METNFAALVGLNVSRASARIRRRRRRSAATPIAAGPPVLHVESDLPLHRVGGFPDTKRRHSEEVTAEFTGLVEAVERPGHIEQLVVGDFEARRLRPPGRLLVEKAALVPERAIVRDETVEKTRRSRVHRHVRENDPSEAGAVAASPRNTFGRFGS